MSLTSGLRTLIVDRQPPYQVAQAWHRMARAAGFRETTMEAHGLRIRVRRLTCDVNFVHNVIENREYFPPEVKIGPADTIVDIGANIGTFALVASRMVPVGRVISVEPDAENVRLLRMNLAQNMHTNNVAVFPYAIAATFGTVAFSAAKEGGYHTILPERFDGATVRNVRALSLGDLFESAQIERCHLLKLDCEGAEYEILPTLSRDVAGRIDQIAMEYHRVQDAERKLKACLDGLGSRFSIVKHEPFEAGGGHMWLTQKR